MRITVLGGTRFIGFALLEDLHAAGHEITVVHRGITEPAGLPPCEHIHVGRDQLRGLTALRGADVLIDMHAMTAADSHALLDAVPEHVRLVVISSVDVYRAFGSLLRDQESDAVPLNEDSPVRTERYPYRDLAAREEGYDKLDVEDLFLPRGATILRLPMVYGERDAQRREEHILRRVRAGRQRIPIGSASWLPTRGYVRDIARGIRLAAETPAAAGQVLNLCESTSYSTGAWAGLILEAAGSSAELVRVPDSRLPADLRELGRLSQHLVMDSRRARELLGWRDSDHLSNLRASVAWHLQNPPPEASTDFTEDDAALAAGPVQSAGSSGG
ncbi:MAG: NAD-dependent dehydratase [Candidatus Dormibacteraeota bacterium]|nr:NAD-dependent dehydratase [Candidatus Dormibacteraeota bacterium]